MSKSEKIALEKFESFITSLKSQDFPLPQTVRNLPPRKDYEGNQALKNVVRALGLKNLRELEERVRNC